MRHLVCICLLLLAITVTSGTAVPRSGATTVTNEDIRDAILQVVNVVRATEDKLERHEYRERNLGEQLKKGMISIDKRIKLLEPFKGTISRLDQRLAQVETILMQKDEWERIQLQKTFEAVEDIQKNLPSIVDTLKSDIINKLEEVKGGKSDIDSFKKDLDTKFDRMTDAIRGIERNLSKIRDQESILNKSSANVDTMGKQLQSGEQLLEKYETKLAEYNNRIPEIPAQYQNDWHKSFLSTLEGQRVNLDQVLSTVTSLASKLDTTRPTETTSMCPATSQQPSIDELTRQVTTLSERFASGHEHLRTEIENVAKVEQVMVQTADSVLDTKRRVEYGVHQIIAEMQQLVKATVKDVASAINERFDTFEMSILDEESGALANLTAKIGHEIDQVWRQIGIMHQQMSASGDTLTKLQNQTDLYVNGSLNVMDNMKGKVGTITSRIQEVDDNLNYLLGKLSLVTQEFNQIKSGLGKALDEMKNTYKTVKDRVGAGPHKIDSAEQVAPSPPNVN